MELTGKEGEFVSQKVASAKQVKHLKFRAEKLKDKDPVRSQFFGKEKLMELLSKPECMGLKIFYGQEENETPNLILVAANKNLKNLVGDSTGLKDGGNGDYLTNGPYCPHVCN
jgi:hypothetical protein